ncbi:MAG: 16S rRNA (uracil(1498)-N(3))-methyltransferase [Flavobacteriia bacterium]|nr:16S rRNA (uracil(1498)-N(3))-methyltransferase [Flavobacteriia bacterium]
MNIYYFPDIDEKAQFTTLPEDESKHCCKVLRQKKGDSIIVMNGKGSFFTCEILENNPKKCLLEIKESEHEQESPFKIHIAICILKNQERMEWFIEKATEIGVHQISFLYSKNSERKKINLERFQKIAIVACKQTQRKHLPILNELISVEEFLSKHSEGAIAHCYSGNKIQLKNNFRKQYYPILIGPEGDFTKEEVELAIEKKYDPISLGKNRLRSETAALYCSFMAKTLIEM